MYDILQKLQMRFKVTFPINFGIIIRTKGSAADFGVLSAYIIYTLWIGGANIIMAYIKR